MYQPFIFKLPSVTLNNKTITSDKDNIEMSYIKPYPLFTLGFHYYLHRTREGMNITKNLQTKTEFYYVVNPFENKISNYEEDIISSTKTYLKTDNNYSNEFQKIWEILFAFDITSNKQTIQIIGSNEIQDCVKLFKEKTIKNNSKDIFVSDKEVKNNSCDLIINNYKKNANDNIEQESYQELLEIVISILKNLADKGSVILQIYDTFTIPTIKLIYILHSCFEEVYIYKPYMSRHSDNEKYLILKKFKIQKNDIIKGLENAHKNLDKKQYLIEIFPDLVLSKNYLNIFKYINIRLINIQQIMCNEIIKYIKENNYFGDKFHESKNKQIEATKWWIKMFYPPSNNMYQTNKELIDKLIKTTIEKNNQEKEKFLSTFI
jgi:hypothetical protein